MLSNEAKEGGLENEFEKNSYSCLDLKVRIQ